LTGDLRFGIRRVVSERVGTLSIADTLAQFDAKQAELAKLQR
jgi:hypothetical protein